MAQSKTLYVTLGGRSGSKAMRVEDCINYLKGYKTQLHDKTAEFVNRLADKGINIANLNLGYYGDCIKVGKRDESTGDAIVVYIDAYDEKKVTSTWWHGGEPVSVTISPILMAEFGAGWKAKVLNYENTPSNVGRGSYSTYGHGYDDDWWWKDYDTKKVEHARSPEHVSEMTPTHPMWETFSFIFKEANVVAREVFGDGI